MIRDSSKGGYYSGFLEYCDLHLDEHLLHECDGPWDDIYTTAEQAIRRSLPGDRELMLADIDELMALPTEQDRRDAFRYELFGVSEEPGAWDAFIADFRARVLREQAGDFSKPLVDPRPELPRRKSRAVSPQGWDNTLPSAGSFPSASMAEAVVDAVLKSYGARVEAFFEGSQPGVTRRLPPMRMRFDRTVGLVAVRDGEPVQTRLAVVLLHDVGGQAHVFGAFPMEEVPEPPRMEALFILLGGWLHADWVDEQPGVPDPLEQVRRFAATEPPETVRTAADQLHALLATGTEDDRRRAVRGLCCFFVPRPAGQLDAFLTSAAEVLDEPR